MQANITVLVGAQWGDEGKGKWIDYFADNIDFVVRYQGGSNAGHTIYVQGEKFVLHQIPSGIFQEKSISAMAAGVVVDPIGLAHEIEQLRSKVTITPDTLWVSARAHVITPWHVYLDSKKEKSQAIGTTKRGIGPTYSEKASRSGLRMGHFVKPSFLQNWISKMKEDPEFSEDFSASSERWKLFFEAAEKLKNFVCDVETKLRFQMAAGKSFLLEGAQGSLLDLDHGTYPFVTSSSTTSAGACTSLGISPKSISKILGVAKAYSTRVGSGPFPTELKDAVGTHLGTVGKEFGATTGRPRRCGWFDAVAFRYSQAVNGFDGVLLNKIDILTGLKELKIATAYKHPSLGVIRDFPWDSSILEECEPVFETFAGWSEAIPTAGNFSKLPRAAFDYVKAIEHHAGIKIMAVGTGPGREECLKP